ncbi:hypothetical protein AB0L26_14725 [Streptomyces nondiastaticus]|uniref:hypothetical protein n=1 Tax=Streptomyces nondiastaticus TaxID=3154512 RepID=UPI003420605B
MTKRRRRTATALIPAALTPALIPVFPTALLALPLCVALAAAGLLPWSVPFSVAAALAVLVLCRHARR